MIDNDTMMMLAKFTFGIRKLNGHLDSNRLMQDADYRAEIFKFVDEQGDENLLMLSFAIQNKLGLLNLPTNLNVNNAQNMPAATQTAAAETDKYIRGARG
jgi:hypothetical protein